MTDKSKATSEAFLVSATEGSTARTTAPASCPTCGGNGNEARPFDANCPAAWAHEFVRLPRLTHCLAECPQSFEAWNCTLPFGHDGNHMARGKSGLVHAEWWDGGFWLE